MTFGTRNEQGKVICNSCGAILGKDGTTRCNFCPRCGSPLNIKAGILQEKLIAIKQLEMLYEMKDSNDPNAIDNYIKIIEDSNK